jgi:hypothetical protein
MYTPMLTVSLKHKQTYNSRPHVSSILLMGTLTVMHYCHFYEVVPCRDYTGGVEVLMDLSRGSMITHKPKHSRPICSQAEYTFF